MSVNSLLDTNIIIYTLESVDLNKYKRAKELVQSGLLKGNCCISRQVIQETLNVATKNCNIPLKTPAIYCAALYSHCTE